ncbi:MAG TPA: proprotein convertase P-domain-containing protein [Thermoanaerobaculia bacterium]|nr:proprotein convertase P-domain-containing protein [Thermoanaerobaculia bacterium]HUM31084.1 proprotein convertase P-domain-containing protein [Thermoanaerobaculia bacterium]HXK69404.1 proprotein convertase P-domain-containing protein [Thermoanaerobaculia bacterium]
MTRMRFVFLLCILAFSASLIAGNGPTYVSDPVVPTISRAVRELPQVDDEKDAFGPEMARRQDYGFSGPDQQGPPKDNPLADLQNLTPRPEPNGFDTLLQNFAGYTSSSSPPDTTGDVGPNHFVQGSNSSGASVMRIFNKSGVAQATIYLEDLASGGSCATGYCDPIVNYDEAADRWVVSEFASSGSYFCVYVSTSPDPTSTWYAYQFSAGYSSVPDYPKYGVWPLDTNGDGQYMEGSYLIGVNAGSTGNRDVWALDRANMLQGNPASTQKFSAPELSGFGFQLFLPAGHEGDAMPPSGNTPALFLRPVDTEVNSEFDGDCSPEPCDIMEIWSLLVDWNNSSNSDFNQLALVKIAEYDHTLCGTGSDWSCMAQPGTAQELDPIREPIHFPLQYRNWGSYQTLVGCFAEDVDGSDRAAAHWFEIRKTGAGAWTLYQEGVLGTTSGSNNVNRSVCSAAMDSSGNIAVGYTRTGSLAPYYPSIYYSGRLATDALGTMPYYDLTIQDATTSKTNNERWGDYAGMGIDPDDDCTFWFVTEYGGSGNTRIAAMKFDQCGCLTTPPTPTASAAAVGNNRIDVSWNDSSMASITRYWVYRSMSSGGPYTQIAEVADTSPGTGNGPGYSYTDLDVSGGTRYYYVVKSNDGGACTSAESSEVNALAQGVCTLDPDFSGVTSVTNAASATCTLNIAWDWGTSRCSGTLTYKVYRDTTPGFTPGPANLIAEGLTGTSHQDLDQLTSGTEYYYVVHAVDSVNSAEDTNTTEDSGIPSGPGSGSNTYTSTDVPKSITDNNTVTSTVTVSDTNVISDVNVTIISLTHTYDGDLDIFLIAPNSTRVELTTDNGGTGENFTNTVFDDSAATSITAGAAPFTGSFRPEGSLATLNGIASNGIWTLEITDDAGGDTGTLTSWSLTLTTQTSCSTGSNCLNNPSSVNVTPNGPLTLCGGTSQQLTATPSGGSELSYQWYDGINPIPLATSATFDASDTGTHSYNCQVKGSGCISAMSDATPTSITWQSTPSFAGLVSVTNPQASTCALDLDWNDASIPCPSGVTYSVYRDTNPGFTPGPANLLVSGLTATAYQDTDNLTSGTIYYYKTHAVSVDTSVEETNTVERSGAPTGPGGGPFTALALEDFEGSWGPQGDNPPAGWTIEDHGSLADGWNNNDWYNYAKGGSYGQVARVYYYPLENQNEWLISPAFDIPGTVTSVNLEYDHYFYVYSAPGEDGYVDFISDQTTSWTQLAHYSSTTGTSSSYAHAVIDLSAYAGETNCQIRFRYVSYDGWYWEVDNVQVTGVVNNACTTGSSVPVEVKNVQWTDASTLTWDQDPACDMGYRVFRGIPADLDKLLVDGTSDSCEKASTSAYDQNSVVINGDDPSGVTGGFYWYLICGESSSGSGPFGNATTGTRYLNSSGDCP